MKYIKGVIDVLFIVLGIALIRQYSGLANFAGWLFVIVNSLSLILSILKEDD